jgi:hypothetical protein
MGGPKDATRTANRVFGLVNGASVWCGFVTGTSLFMTATSGTGFTTALFEVSIDGSGYFEPSRHSAIPGMYVIFTGRPDQEYKICVRFKSSAYDTAFMTNVSPCMVVEGTNPKVETFTTWLQCNDGNNLIAWSSTNTALSPATFVPPSTPGLIAGVSGTGIPSLRFTTTAKRMVVINPDPFVFVSIDGAAYTRYKATTAFGVYHVTYIDLPGGAHTYNVWQGSARGTNNVFAIGIDAAVTDCGAKRRLDQYGSSTTAGAGVGAANSDGQVETMSVAAALGMVGSTYGISGETIAGFVARMTALLAAKTVVSADVAVLQLGANDIGALDATATTNINNIITAMLAKGYGKVIVRGHMSTLGQAGGTLTSKTNDNLTLAGIVTAFGNANVTFVNPIALGWGIIDSPDTTHPSVVGYQTITPLAISAYTPLI